MQKKMLGVLCAVVLVGILSAGLWPFHAPKNQVSWLSNGNGLHFGEYGVILGPGASTFLGPKDEIPGSLEIWLQPDHSDIGGTILAFYNPENRIVAFSVHQSIDDLFLQRVFVHQQRPTKSKVYIGHVFRKNKPLFVTLTLSAQGTAVYLNGGLVRTFPRFGLSSADLTGQLFAGNHPLVENGWQGQLRGLAIYNRALTETQVLQHYNAWTTNQNAEIKNEGPIALYLFNEGSGTIVHNQMNLETDLRIPEHFFVLHAPFLETPWDEFQPSWSYWKNVLINIGGFVPLGFFFCAYFASVRRLDRAALATIVLGGVVSLTIEVLQAFLPTRDSGMTDLITNTLGTGIGTALYSSTSVRAIFATVGLGGLRQPVSRERSASPSGYLH
jgi:VanZ like protein/concanavalin A-like lectin/glucanase superfamily protein